MARAAHFAIWATGPSRFGFRPATVVPGPLPRRCTNATVPATSVSRPSLGQQIRTLQVVMRHSTYDAERRLTRVRIRGIVPAVRDADCR